MVSLVRHNFNHYESNNLNNLILGEFGNSEKRRPGFLILLISIHFNKKHDELEMEQGISSDCWATQPMLSGDMQNELAMLFAKLCEFALKSQ